MPRFLTARDLPDVMTLRDVAEWSGVTDSALLVRLRNVGDVPPPDGVHGGKPFWLSTTVLRWRAQPRPGGALR